LPPEAFATWLIQLLRGTEQFLSMCHLGCPGTIWRNKYRDSQNGLPVSTIYARKDGFTSFHADYIAIAHMPEKIMETG